MYRAFFFAAICNVLYWSLKIEERISICFFFCYFRFASFALSGGRVAFAWKKKYNRWTMQAAALKEEACRRQVMSVMKELPGSLASQINVESEDLAVSWWWWW